MKVILMENLPKLGESGKVVDVKDGYARNYLIPQKLALQATPGAFKIFERFKVQKAGAEEKRLLKIKELAEKLEGISCDILVRVDDEDHLFGSVNPQMIADALKDKGFDIDKKAIIIDEPITSLGVYSVKIKLANEYEPNIRLWVVKI